MKNSETWYNIDKQSGWPLWVLAALVAYATFLFVPQVLGDSDTYLHIAAGEWILNHSAIPHTDPFSYTFLGKPWIAHEWLAECLMALSFRLGGWDAEVILFGITIALTLILLVNHLSQWLSPLATASTVIVIMACISPSLLARPHIFALLTLEIWVAGLLMARHRAQSPSPFLLLIMILWANIHGSFIFGLLLIGPFALEAILAARKAWKKTTCYWGLFFIASVAAAMITPQGWQGLLFPFQLVMAKPVDAITEWRSTDFSTIQPIEVALLATLYVCLSRGVRVPLIRLLVLLGLMHLALQHTRFQMLAGLIGGMILAEPLGLAFGSAQLTNKSHWTKHYTLPRITSFFVLGVLLTAARIMHPVQCTDRPNSPVSALEHVPANLAATPVLNEYAFGGYLIFKGVHPFIDGRIDMYGNTFMAEYLAMMAPDRTLLEHTLTSNHIQWTILAASSPAIQTMDSLPGWHRLYSDNVAVVHTLITAP